MNPIIKYILEPELNLTNIGFIAPYQEFIENMVVLDDLSIGMAIEFRPFPMDGRGVSDLSEKLAVLERVFNGFPDNFSFQFVMERNSDYRKYVSEIDDQLQGLNLDHKFREPFVSRILSNRKEWYRQRVEAGLIKIDSYYIFVVSKTKPSEFVTMDQYWRYMAGTQYRTKLHDFARRSERLKAVTSSLVTTLNEIGAESRVLSSTETMTVIYRYMNFLKRVPPISVATENVFNILYSGDYVITKNFLHCEGRFASVLSMVGPPIINDRVDHPSIFLRMYSHLSDYYVSFNIDMLNSRALSKKFDSQRFGSKIFSKAKALFLAEVFKQSTTADDIEDAKDRRFDVQADELGAAKEMIDIQNKRFCYGELLTVATHSDLAALRSIEDEFITEYEKVYGTICKPEKVTNFYCWVASLPFCGYRGIRKNTAYVGDALRMTPMLGRYYGNSTRNRMTLSNVASGAVSYNPYDPKSKQTIHHKMVIAKCQVPGTPVPTPDGFCEIERFVIGQEVLSVNETTGQEAKSVVIDRFKLKEQPTRIFLLDDGTETEVPPDHYFVHIQDGLLTKVLADTLNAGDHIPVPVLLRDVPSGVDLGCVFQSRREASFAAGKIRLTEGHSDIMLEERYGGFVLWRAKQSDDAPREIWIYLQSVAEAIDMKEVVPSRGSRVEAIRLVCSLRDKAEADLKPLRGIEEGLRTASDALSKKATTRLEDLASEPKNGKGARFVGLDDSLAKSEVRDLESLRQAGFAETLNDRVKILGGKVPSVDKLSNILLNLDRLAEYMKLVRFRRIVGVSEGRSVLHDICCGPYHTYLTSTSVSYNSGSGKSFFANEVIYSKLVDNAYVYIIDVGGSYKKVCSILRGNYIAARGAKGTKFRCINPFAGLGKMKLQIMELEKTGSKDSDDYLDLRDQFMLQRSVAMRAMEIMMREEQMQGISKAIKGRITEIVNELENRFGEQEFTLEHVKVEMSRIKELEPLTYNLANYCEGGQFQGFFNRPNELELTAGFTVFDLEGLNEEELKELRDVMFLVINNYILGQFYRYRDKDKLFIIDEAQEMLKDKETARIAEKAFRQHRKLGGADIIISQSIGDYDFPEGRAILNNLAEVIILAASEVELAKLRELVGWNDSEDYIITEKQLRVVAGDYSTFYIRSDLGRSIIKLAVPKFEYWLATTHNEDLKALAEAARKSGNVVHAIENIMAERGEKY